LEGKKKKTMGPTYEQLWDSLVTCAYVSLIVNSTMDPCCSTWWVPHELELTKSTKSKKHSNM
jgi:hypothetical protein